MRLRIIAVILLLSLCCASFTIGGGVPSQAYYAYNNSETHSIDIPVSAPNLLEKISELLFGSNTFERITEKVYLGGTPIGLSLESKGITIIGISNIFTRNGNVCPALDAGLIIGDIIISLEDNEIYNVSQLTKLSERSQGNPMKLTYIRQGNVCDTKISAALDITSNKYKLGLWAREVSSGIGTLTYVETNGKFACLGHPIINSNDGSIIEISGGKAYNCTINGYKKGVSGNAGELHGYFTGDKPIGNIAKNNKYGVYGNIDEISFNKSDLISVASVNEVKTGKAYIYTTIDGSVKERYEIEIIKVSYQPTKSDKGLIIRITDKRLLDTTGGIVQGMSGSPIVQNGKLVGAVTHVFVSDATKGYGLLAQWMLEE